MVWYDNNYGYKKKITIDHTKVGGDETDFPVLISVTDNDLRDEANGGHVRNTNGYDIIFTNSAETVQLKHEIELYTNTDGTLVYWVKLPSISSTNNTDFYIYCGKSGVVADPSTTDTWDSSFLGVYHLDESAGATCYDSTSNSNNLTYTGNLPTQSSFEIGYGQDFDGTNDGITIPNSMFSGGVSPLTFECIYKADVTDTEGELMCLGRDGSDILWARVDSDAKYSYGGYCGNQLKFMDDGTDSYDTNTHVIGYTWADADDMAFYEDGVSLTTDTSYTWVDWTPVGGSRGCNIGIRWDSAGDFDGKMDEVRFSTVRRSNNWLTTTYETEKNPSTFMSWGAEEAKPAGEIGADIYYHDGTNNIELQRDDSSPVQMYNGTSVIGLKLGATNDANASPIHVYDGTTIKAVLKMP